MIYGVNAQSTKIDFPTPVTTDEIKGKIPARDIGDSRLTTHYYVFEGNKGDVFINIEANNLNGDIDIFLAENLKPLTKINLYADSGATQTGREIYLRKEEKLILRVEGRTPNDDPATYFIKFSGSFQTVAANAVKEEPKISKIKEENEGQIKVNSVGTIVETKPKPVSVTKETAAQKSNTKNSVKSNPVPVAVSTIKPKSAKTPVKPKVEESLEPEKKVEVVVTDNLPKPNQNIAKVPENKASDIPKPKKTKLKNSTKKGTTAKVTKAEPIKPKNTKAEELTKALETVRLVVDFKDGSKIERPLSEVLKFGVDKGILTIINKDGSVGKYSFLEIAKISVE